MDKVDKISKFCEKFAEIAEVQLEKTAEKKAKVRNRGDVVFPAESPKVKDNKDHYPLNNEAQARNALQRASQHAKVPDWYKGSLSELVKTVARKVKQKFPSIEVSEKSKKPGKG